MAAGDKLDGDANAFFNARQPGTRPRQAGDGTEDGAECVTGESDRRRPAPLADRTTSGRSGTQLERSNPTELPFPRSVAKVWPLFGQ